MSWYLGRNIEPAFAGEAEWDPDEPNLRTSVRQITWHDNLETNALMAHNASHKTIPILVERTVSHITLRTIQLGTGHLT